MGWKTLCTICFARSGNPVGDVRLSPADRTADANRGGQRLIADKSPNGPGAQFQNSGEVPDRQQFRELAGVCLEQLPLLARAAFGIGCGGFTGR